MPFRCSDLFFFFLYLAAASSCAPPNCPTHLNCQWTPATASLFPYRPKTWPKWNWHSYSFHPFLRVPVSHSFYSSPYSYSRLLLLILFVLPISYSSPHIFLHNHHHHPYCLLCVFHVSPPPHLYSLTIPPHLPYHPSFPPLHNSTVLIPLSLLSSLSSNSAIFPFFRLSHHRQLFPSRPCLPSSVKCIHGRARSRVFLRGLVLLAVCGRYSCYIAWVLQSADIAACTALFSLANRWRK